MINFDKLVCNYNKIEDKIHSEIQKLDENYITILMIILGYYFRTLVFYFCIFKFDKFNTLDDLRLIQIGFPYIIGILFDDINTFILLLIYVFLKLKKSYIRKPEKYNKILNKICKFLNINLELRDNIESNIENDNNENEEVINNLENDNNDNEEVINNLENDISVLQREEELTDSNIDEEVEKNIENDNNESHQVTDSNLSSEINISNSIIDNIDINKITNSILDDSQINSDLGSETKKDK